MYLLKVDSSYVDSRGQLTDSQKDAVRVPDSVVSALRAGNVGWPIEGQSGARFVRLRSAHSSSNAPIAVDSSAD